MLLLKYKPTILGIILLLDSTIAQRVDTLVQLQQLSISYVSSVEQQSQKLHEQLDHSIEKQLSLAT